MPDHIHMFIRSSTSNIEISKVVQIIKGYSSFIIRKKYIFFKKYKAFWSPTYFIESVGNISEKVVKKYIDNQKINVKPSYTYKNLITKVFKTKQQYNVMNGYLNTKSNFNISIQIFNNEEFKQCKTSF